MRRLQCFTLLTVLLFFIQNNSLSAQDTARNDSARTGAFTEKIQALTRKIQLEATADNRNDRESMKQDIIFDLIRKNMQRAKSYLKTGIDTTGIMEAVHKITAWQALANEDPGNKLLPTYRDLTVTYNMVLDMQARLRVYKSGLDTYKQTLAGFKLRIDSLASDSSMYSLASDSAILKDYLQRLVTMAREVSPTGDLLEKAIKTTNALQTVVDVQVYTLEARKEELELSQRHLYSQMLAREYPDIWQPAAESRSFQAIVSYSVRKSLLTLRLYAGNNSGKIFLLLILTALSAVYINSLKKIYREKKLLAGDYTNRLILRYPSLSAIIIVFNVFQFIFPTPPFLLNCILWFIPAVALSVVFYGFISAYWMRFWLCMFLFFLLACLDNNILQASRTEQWLMLLLSVAGTATGLATMLRGDKKALKEQWIVYAIGLMIGLELLAITANCIGRYNLAKALMISGYLNVVIAIMFLWVVRLINEGLSLAVDVYSVQDKRLFYVNFDRVGSRAPAIFYVFMIIG